MAGKDAQAEAAAAAARDQCKVSGGGGHDEDDAGGSASGGDVTSECPMMPVPPPGVIIVSASDWATLVRERKLILILDLDLDHTLLHSTSLNKLSPALQSKQWTPDTFRLDFDHDADYVILTKLRPFVLEFLEKASGMFEIYVYTYACQGYARAAVKQLDPGGVYVGDRIVSRDDSRSAEFKSLSVIPGAEPKKVVIIDDTESVWHWHQENLIVIEKYFYFDVPTQMELEERHGSLAKKLDLLKCVRSSFFASHRTDDDVRPVIRRELDNEEGPLILFRESDNVETGNDEFGLLCRDEVFANPR